jgi:hypothetical protein
MKNRSFLVAAIAASITILASGEARAAPPWSFAKTNGAWTPNAVASSTPALDVLVFNVATTAVPLSTVKQMTFQVTGTGRTAEVANFQLVFYRDGLGTPGMVVGSNTGAGWGPGKSHVVVIDLATPVAFQGAASGFFALRVDVNAPRTFFFQPELRTVTMVSEGVARLVRETEDLPLPGDSFYVN